MIRPPRRRRLQRERNLRLSCHDYLRHVTRSGARPPGIGTLAIPRDDPHAVRTVPTIASATLRHASRPIEMLGSRFTVPVLQLGSRRPVPTRGLLSRAVAREPHRAPAPAADRAAHTTAAATDCSRCRRPAGLAGYRRAAPRTRAEPAVSERRVRPSAPKATLASAYSR